MTDTIREERLSEQVTLYCGDSLEVMARRLRDNEDGSVDVIGRMAVDHVITDPPYEAITHDSKNSKSPDRMDGGPELRALDFAPIDDIRRQVVELAYPICSGWFIAFCTVEGVARWADVINPSPMKYKRACIWVKPDAAPQLNGQCPAQGAECFVCAWCGQGHSRWNGGGKRGVYTHNTKNRDRHGVHPTEKPLNLMREIITDFTKPGDLVLDPFMGSGTTGVACVQTGRRFVGVEMNPQYYDIARQRIEDALSQGSLFDAEPAPRAQQLVFA